MSFIAWIVVIALIVGGLFLWQRTSDAQKCKDMALAAAVDAYPMNEYPNTGQREVLQQSYERSYMTSCQ